MSKTYGQTVRKITALLTLVAAGMWSFPADAQDTDVYVVYSRATKADKNQLLKAFSKSYSVKAYMADLLVVADYSAKQKILARFGSARLVVLLPGVAVETLKGSTIRAPVLIANRGIDRLVASNAWIVNVAVKGPGLENLGDDAKVLEISSEADLGDLQAIRSADVVVVDESAIKLQRVIALITDRVLRRS